MSQPSSNNGSWARDNRDQRTQGGKKGIQKQKLVKVAM